MRELFRQLRSTRWAILAGSTLITLALLVIAGAALVARPAALPTLKPDEPCPITLPREMLLQLAPVAGTLPVWVTSYGQVPWSEFSPSQIALAPYRGGKRIWVIDTRVQGDLQVTGRQLDGDGIVLFAQRDPDDKQAMPLLTIPSAQEGPMGSAPGFQFHGSVIYYPGPGCYQLTATLAEYTVQIVIEILDE